MSIHKVTNIFVGNGSALEADVNTLTAGKLGVFKADQTALGAASPYIASTATDNIQLSETFSDGSFKKSMVINGRSVKTAKFEKYAPAAREVWAIGYDRKLATGSIEVNNSTDYTFSINFKNDKSLYSERPEVLRGNFVSAAAATQLTIATQIAAVINNGGFKSLIAAIVVGNGTGVYGLTAATNYGVEITAKDINQFQSSTYKENRVYFSCQVDDSTGFGSTTTCTQIQANSYGTGTYNGVYNKENFEYQYEGLSNRRLWPAQAVKFNVVNTGYLSANVAAAATTPTGNVTTVINEDVVTVATATTGLRGGELIDIDGVSYEIKYILSATKFVITVPATASYGAAANIKVKYFYDIIVLTFADNAFTSGADVIAQAQKALYIATPSINVTSADPFDKANLDTAGFSTEGVALLTNIGAWLAGTPTGITTAALIA